MSEDKYQEILSALATMNERLRVLEANQRNAESGTTACSAAGGGIEQMKTARSAGRAPLLSEVMDVIQRRRSVYAEFCEEVPSSNIKVMVEEYDALMRDIAG